MTATDLTSLQRTLRQMLPDEGISAVLAALKKALPEGTDLYNAVFQLETRLNATNKDRLRGVLSQEQLELAYNRISADLLDLIDGLELEHFDVATADGGGAANKTGSILYRIPHTMEVEEEYRCVVRLAFDDEVIIRNIEITRDTVLKDVRVSEVMEVELIDPNPTPSFAIRKLNSAEQFLEKNDYTEWIFFVKPLLTGELPLVLRIAVLEIIDEHERKKEIVLEEVIHVVADAPEPGAAGAAAEFKNAGYTIATGDSGGQSRDKAPSSPAPTSPAPARPTAAPKAAEGKRRYALVLLVLLMAMAGIWAAGRMAGWWGNSALSESETQRDRADWQSALRSGTKDAFGGYLEKHPEGLFKSVARYKLDSILLSEQTSGQVPPERDSSSFQPSEATGDADEGELGTETSGASGPQAMKKRAVRPAKPQAGKPAKPNKTAPTLPQPVGPPKPDNLPATLPEAPTPPPKRRSGFEMVAVKGGSMSIGCEGGGKDECPHPVTVANFKMGKYEVTQADWKEVMGNNPSHFNYSRCSECPVEKVSWEEVMVFAKKASEKYGVRFRLPSEAEWEYAARGGAASKGFKYAGSNRSGEVGWYHDNSEETHRVGQKKPNELGLHDMSGNVWEWCLDTYKPYPGCKSNTTDDRIIRGGSFRNYGSKGRTCNRNFMWPTKKEFNVGFRLVQEN